MSNTAYVNTGANPTWRSHFQSRSSMTGKTWHWSLVGPPASATLAQQCLRHGFSVIITAASGCPAPGAVAGTGKRNAST
jgi:hypothetical protein